MKKYLLLALICLFSLGAVAQRHHDRRPNDRRPMPTVRYASHEQVEAALRTMDQQSFDDRRLEIAKLCVLLCPFRVSDIARMGNKFSFEEKKLEFFCYAYSYCADPENYFQLRDFLKFSTDFDKLLECTGHPDRRR